MAFKISKLLGKGGSRSPEKLPGDVRKALEAWRAGQAPELDEWHYHVRYVVVDIATAGPSAADSALLGISAVGVQGGSIMPADAFTFDLAAGDVDGDAVDRQLMAFLAYTAKAPLVTYHSPFVASFLKPALQNRLGVNFSPRWVDLAWMLPSLYQDKSVTLLPLDDWLERLGIHGQDSGRRDTMTNALMLARLFQMVLARAIDKEVLTAEKLVEESQATVFLRRSH
jgi:DNA polymerase-3 subunit epsilon